MANKEQPVSNAIDKIEIYAAALQTCCGGEPT